MKNGIIIRRIFLAILAIAVFFGQIVPLKSANALLGIDVGKIGSSVVGSMSRDVMKMVGVDPSSVQNLSQEFNVSDTKKYSPEVSLYFSPSDPKEGQKISAKALPVYFTNPAEQLYYAWFLKRKGCDIGGNTKGCDDDGDGRVTVNDWKVAATKIILTGDVDTSGFKYDGDDDGDGFKAPIGGGSEAADKHDWCYLRDASSGIFYELGPDSSASDSISCDARNYVATCILEDSQNSGSYAKNGALVCGNGATSCASIGNPYCVHKSVADSSFGLNETIAVNIATGNLFNGTRQSSCPMIADPVTGLPIADPNCEVVPVIRSGEMTCSAYVASTGRCPRLFPDPKNTGGSESGDGKFSLSEEKFWGTDPHDPDTADNGNKDEANVVGLGLNSFTWNYRAGDQVGVVVEGTSMVPTKHDDSSNMIMWAFSGKGCDVTDTGSYNMTVKGQSVNFPTTGMGRTQLDACLEKNLVDPIQGGQAKKLELDVTATPENPMNDQSGEKLGDIVTAVASISNAARSDSEISYEWTVEVGDDSGMTSPKDITGDLRSAGLLSSSKGNGLNSISVSLNMGNSILGGLSGVDPLYMRISSTAKENFGEDVARKGKSDVIVKISNSNKKIIAYGTTASDTSAGSRVALDQSICNVFHPTPATVGEAMENLDKVSCRVMKNEIIGVRVDPAGLSNFHWTIGGQDLSCDASVSGDADCAKGNEVFFAVSGEPGTAINVQLDAVDVVKGKAVTLTRSFNIVTPDIAFEPVDKTVLWPRVVGQYVDLDGATHDDFSGNFFEKAPDSKIQMRARFIPTFAGRISTQQWRIDGLPTDETVWNTPDGNFPGVDYVPTGQAVGDISTVSVSATLIQPVEKRKALRDIWGIDASQSAETTITKSVQVTNVASATTADSGVKKFYAALSGYVPPAVSFVIRMILSGGLLLFTVGFVFSLIPETASDPVRRRDER